ncbi:hypothetical protein ACJX0J_015834, partial [Zea mays]
YVKVPIFTLCVGNAWGEAALLLAAGAKGNRAALPSSTIMIKQPIGRFQGQATDVDIARKEIRNVKIEMVKLLARHIGKPMEEIARDIRRPKYFSPSEAVDYGIIDKVIYNEKIQEDGGVRSFSTSRHVFVCLPAGSNPQNCNKANRTSKGKYRKFVGPSQTNNVINILVNHLIWGFTVGA